MHTNSLDFNKIRNYKGSQNNAFEELICQLARLSPPKNAEDFIRKEGSGGDAGVECFWKLKDGSEHAWQAKYFLNTIQWDQISHSVKIALAKHPKLKKYYICLPLDRTDRRRDTEESQMNKWNKKVKEWEEIAKTEGRDVKFKFWGASEIVGKLSTDDPHFSGRALYWFNNPILQMQHLKNIAEKAKQSLGGRFSPDFNVELPIAKSFDGIGLTPKWYPRFCSIREKWLKALKNLKDTLNREDTKLTKEKWESIKDFIFHLENLLNKVVNEKFLYKNIEQLKKDIRDLKENMKMKMDYSEVEIEQKINCYFNLFSDATHQLSKFLFSKDMMAFSIKSMLLSGDAGAGKSHLLCDITLNRLEDKLPTVFLLGQHYAGGDPLKFISDSLDLNNHSYKEMLGALDAIGETYSTRTLIIIDAINEGLYKEHWKEHIIKLITELKSYPYIALVFSCRSTYLPYLLPQIKNSGKASNEAKLTVEIKHTGFSDQNQIYKYLEKQDFFPNIPIMAPEFSNPLFLKIYCKYLTAKGENRFSEGSKSIETIFNSYVDSVSETINSNKQYRQGEKIVSKTLQAFALKLFPNNLSGLSIDKAREIIKAKDPNPNTGDLFNELLNEGILSEDIKFIPNGENGYKKEEIVRFTYDRFSDYFIAKSLIEKEIYKKPKKLKKIINHIKHSFYKIISKKFCLKNENLKLYFKKGSTLGNIFFNNLYYINAGIIEALFTIVADEFKVELYDLIEREDKQHFLKEPLKQSFLWRSPDSFTSRTFELLSQIEPIHFHSPMLQILLKLSVKPNHPWSADKLHKILINKTMIERDQLWSTHISFSYHYDEVHNDADKTIKNLINWPYSSYFKNMDSEHIRLYVMVLTWFTTSSHRKLRDRATKAAIIILSEYPEHLLDLMDKFLKVNDLYVRERLYAIAYGVVVNIEGENLIKKIAEKTYEQVFKTGKPTPHILLRDYARCILEFAYKKKLLSDEIDPKSFRPPYKSEWPIENPMDSEIDALTDNKTYRSSVYYSLMNGDFGIYTMRCVFSFSPTPLTKECPETGTELQRKFKDRYGEQKNLNEKQREEKRWLFDGDGSFFIMDDGPASFSRKWAKRWVCKQVYKMGWSEKLFEEFDKEVSSLGYRNKFIERIGKKYQWIALHKLLAYLADNVHYIGQYNDKNKYEGPWQMGYIGDIDPSCYLRKTKADLHFGVSSTKSWWQPYVLKVSNEDIEQQEKWFESKNDAPLFKKILQVKKSTDDSLWTVLHTFVKQQKEKGFYQPECWFRVNTVIISKKDHDFLYKALKDKDLRGTNIAEGGGITNRFLREHPTNDNIFDNNWEEKLSGNNFRLNIKHLLPVMEYVWEFGNGDHSIDKTISFYIPSKTLIDKLNLSYPPKKFEDWVNSKDISVFKDPSITSEGPSCALIKTDILNSWLNKDNLCLMWLIGGEKRLYRQSGRRGGKLHGFSGIYFINNSKIEGNLWFFDISSWSC